MEKLIRELVSKELKKCDVSKGLSVDDIKLNSDLGIKIIENVIRNMVDVPSKCNCTRSGLCRYESVIAGTPKTCRHKITI
jgi:hypothetical protein